MRNSPGIDQNILNRWALISLALVCPLFSPMQAGMPVVRAQEAVGQIRALPLFEQCGKMVSDQTKTSAAMAAIKAGDRTKRVEAITSLGRSCEREASALIIPLLRDDDPTVKIAAIEALAQLGDRNSIDPLIEAITDKDWRVRAALGRALCSFQIYQSNNAALNALANPGGAEVKDEGDLRARCLAILSINQLHDVRFSRKAVGFVFTFLNYQDPKLHAIAEETMAELKNTRNGYHELTGILKQSNFPDFRRKAVFWLGKYQIEEAREFLTEIAASDRDPVVQKMAAEALSGIKKQ